jgi:hypothetical protein
MRNRPDELNEALDSLVRRLFDAVESFSTCDLEVHSPDPLMRAVAWSAILGFLGLGGLALASCLFHWEGFWRGARRPYATTLAALAAVSAAAIASYVQGCGVPGMRPAGVRPGEVVYGYPLLGGVS